ncbi:hypothetical protein P8C59_006888 [Phyllachora maydis]|uniref:Uncharacterized protein n=1 Tax=Phyllachora maydis TaxID=1825666 RepID=A0AAD9MEZ6_9PEZI|nr:hypothetical protein P8C59_006888 [Phyllachora maydis]
MTYARPRIRQEQQQQQQQLFAVRMRLSARAAGRLQPSTMQGGKVSLSRSVIHSIDPVPHPGRQHANTPRLPDQ